ncbi:MAG: hypothetical protein ACRDUS_12910 [Mycobacterium sp.]
MAVHDVVSGWRVWYTRPAEERLTLYSPMYGTELQGFQPSNCRTNTRTMRAVCSLLSAREDPVTGQRIWGRHNPPSPGCRCGIYAVTNVVDAIYRLRAMVANIRRGDIYNCWFPLNPDRGMVPVLARVRLRQVVEHNDIGTWSILSQVRRQIKTSTPVVRAASAEITRIYITDELAGAKAADSIAQRLAMSFGVETFGGDYPTFSSADWDSRPEWMCTEPWSTLYAVDSILAGVYQSHGMSA